jgi:hypothetical protein
LSWNSAHLASAATCAGQVACRGTRTPFQQHCLRGHVSSALLAPPCHQPPYRGSEPAPHSSAWRGRLCLFRPLKLTQLLNCTPAKSGNTVRVLSSLHRGRWGSEGRAPPRVSLNSGGGCARCPNALGNEARGRWAFSVPQKTLKVVPAPLAIGAVISVTCPRDFGPLIT